MDDLEALKAENLRLHTLAAEWFQTKQKMQQQIADAEDAAADAEEERDMWILRACET